MKSGWQLMPSPWGTVKRTDFNMGKYAPYVGDDVTIDIAIEAIKR